MNWSTASEAFEQRQAVSFDFEVDAPGKVHLIDLASANQFQSRLDTCVMQIAGLLVLSAAYSRTERSGLARAGAKAPCEFGHGAGLVAHDGQQRLEPAHPVECLIDIAGGLRQQVAEEPEELLQALGIGLLGFEVRDELELAGEAAGK